MWCTVQSSSLVDFGTSLRALALHIFAVSEFDFLFLCGNLLHKWKRLRGLYIVSFSLEECMKKWTCPSQGMSHSLIEPVFICDQDHILPDTFLFDF